MSDITFLSPATVSALTTECKALITNLTVEILDEDLMQKISGDDTIFLGRFNIWEAAPLPKLRRIDSTTAVETIMFAGTDYTLDLAAGEVTLTAGAGTDIIRADYFYNPISDALLESLLGIALKEVSVLIHRPIDDTNILTDYQAAVCKRLYTNVLKNLMVEARNFFSVSIGDRTINKEQIPAQLEAIKEQNEKDLLLEVNQLRYWNKTKRFGE